MIERRTMLCLVGFAAAATLRPAATFAQSTLDGDFGGVLDTGSGKLRLRLILTGDTAVLYSLDQGNTPIPASKVERSGNDVTITFAVLNALFVARLDGDVLTGTFDQGRPMPLTLQRGVIPADGPLTGLLSGPLDARRLDQIRAVLKTPGMAAGWQTRQGRAVQLSAGLRAAGERAAIAPGDRWHLGSITKSFTATLFARSVERGVIGWDTPLGSRLDNVPAAYAGLTPLELLSHTAGLPANPPLAALLSLPRIEADPGLSRRRYAELVLAQPPAAPRGSFLYSNAGYVLAALMLEQSHGGERWEALVGRDVLRPLGIRSAGFGPPGHADRIDQPRGHVAGQPVLLDNPVAMAPAGALHMALPDLQRYLAAHRDGHRILSRASWDLLHTARPQSRYALGWFVERDGSLWHNGSNTAWYAEVAIDRPRALTMALCCNDPALTNRPRALLPAMVLAAERRPPR